MGRPVKIDRRRVVDTIFYVAATGCDWRALPDSYPNWNTVHATTSTGRATAPGNASPSALPRRAPKRGSQGEPSAGIVDARSVRAGATVIQEIQGI